jgi:hypothetical protein
MPDLNSVTIYLTGKPAKRRAHGERRAYRENDEIRYCSDCGITDCGTLPKNSRKCSPTTTGVEAQPSVIPTPAG